ncbi:MAG TPA: hypothetical protein VF987_05985 [Rhodospirillales bacterium]
MLLGKGLSGQELLPLCQPNLCQDVLSVLPLGRNPARKGIVKVGNALLDQLIEAIERGFRFPQLFP